MKAYARAGAALRLLLEDVFDEQTDFDRRSEPAAYQERVEAALARLEQSAGASASEVTLLATLHGLTIASEELALTKGLTIAQQGALRGVPDGAPADGLLVVFTRRRGRRRRRDRTRARGAEGPAARAAPVRRRSRDARRARLGAGRRRLVESNRARRGWPPARNAGGERRAGGRAARVLQPRLPPCARRQRAGLGAAALRARLRARERVRGAERPSAGAARAARAGGPRERPAGGADRRAVRDPGGPREADQAHGQGAGARARPRSPARPASTPPG